MNIMLPLIKKYFFLLCCCLLLLTIPSAAQMLESPAGFVLDSCTIGNGFDTGFTRHVFYLKNTGNRTLRIISIVVENQNPAREVLYSQFPGYDKNNSTVLVSVPGGNPPKQNKEEIEVLRPQERKSFHINIIAGVAGIATADIVVTWDSAGIQKKRTLPFRASLISIPRIHKGAANGENTKAETDWGIAQICSSLGYGAGGLANDPIYNNSSQTVMIDSMIFSGDTNVFLFDNQLGYWDIEKQWTYYLDFPIRFSRATYSLQLTHIFEPALGKELRDYQAQVTYHLSDTLGNALPPFVVTYKGSTMPHYPLFLSNSGGGTELYYGKKIQKGIPDRSKWIQYDICFTGDVVIQDIKFTGSNKDDIYSTAVQSRGLPFVMKSGERLRDTLVFTPQKTGAFYDTIRIVYIDPYTNRTDTLDRYYYGTVVEPTSVEDNTSNRESAFEIYPNPSGGDLVHIVCKEDAVFARIKAVNILGVSSELYTGEVQAGKPLPVNIEFLPSGMYSIVIEYDNKYEVLQQHILR